MAAIKLCRLDTPIIFIKARINLSRFVVTGCAAKTSPTVTFPSLNLISLIAFCFNIWLNGVASYFFFQAEDGIRVYKVTGVQTCALPISGVHLGGIESLRQDLPRGGEEWPQPVALAHPQMQRPGRPLHTADQLQLRRAHGRH